MKDRYHHLMHLTTKELQNYLTSKAYPPLMHQQIFKTVTEQQQRRANSKRRGAQVTLHWLRIQNPLNNEIKVVRSMQAYDRENEARAEALRGYMEVLRYVFGLIRLAKWEGLTPKKYQEQRIASGKPPYPNNLEHWSDLVPEKIKERVHALFAAIPYKPKAKQKIPFKRD